MTSERILIVTGWDGSLGTGHLQRMTALLDRINHDGTPRAFLVMSSVPDFFPRSLRSFIKSSPEEAELIIRDMRDSGPDEIRALQAFAPVLTLDDNGPGREEADFTLDLLPNIKRTDPANDPFRRSIFLYGHTFIQSLRALAGRSIGKSVDFAVYPGFHAEKKYVDFLLSLLPPGSRIAILCGEDSFLLRNGVRHSLEGTSYGEIILSSRVILSHFGIMLYEGLLAGCRLVSVNPTVYHSRLCDLAGLPGHLNLGTAEHLDMKGCSDKISLLGSEAPGEDIPVDHVLNKVIENIDRFHSYLKSLTR